MKIKGGVDHTSTRSFQKHSDIIKQFLLAKDLNELASSYWYPWLRDEDFSLQIGKSVYEKSFGKWEDYLKYAEQQGKPFYYTMSIFLTTSTNNIDKLFEYKSFIEKYLVDNLYNKSKEFFRGHLHLEDRSGKIYDDEYDYVKTTQGFYYKNGYVHMYYIIIFDNYVMYISYDILKCELQVNLHMLKNLYLVYKNDFELPNIKFGYIEDNMY
jgi:hypothetical protein